MDDFSSDHIERNGGFYSYPILPLMTEEDKKRAYKALEESIKRTKLLAEKQKLSGSNNFNLRDYQ